MYGWLDYETICNNQNINVFYNFIAETLIAPIKLQKNDNDNEIDNIYSIDINLNENSDKIILLKDAYSNWLNTNKKMIINIPHILPFYINRNNNKNKINIQRRIKLDPNDMDNTVDWIFHSAICLNDEHYYTLLQNCGKWYIYDNNNVPCIYEVKMKDVEIINKVMTEVVMIFYVYNQ